MNLFSGLVGQHSRTPIDVSAVVNGYIECALWSSTDENDEPMDANYSVDDIAPETLAKMCEDVAAFVAANSRLLRDSGLTESQIGHDFWLTRNGHGVGFWDRDLDKVGEQLTKACDAFPHVDLYVGDNFKIYQA